MSNVDERDEPSVAAELFRGQIDVHASRHSSAVCLSGTARRATATTLAALNNVLI
jgi:hypothetical protein